MLIVPAIDIMRGKVVRLEKGDFETAKVYPLSPVDFAKKWEAEGAKLIHIVDLDGARAGIPLNFEVIKEIIKSVNIKVEVGGGIRSVETMLKYFESGVERVVLSTKVIDDPSFLQEEEVKKNIKKIAMSLDFKRIEEKPSSDKVGASKVPTLITGSNAWYQDVEIGVPSFIRYLSGLGIEYLNFSDISRDGMMSGPDTKKILNFLSAARGSSTHPLFFTYAGGISSLKDIKMLSSLGKDGVDALIVGRALYENKFSLKEAIDVD